MDSSDLDALTWPEVGRRLARDPRLLLAVGALEQHGAHLPLGTNVRIADAVAREVARETGVLRAPTLSYGVTLPGGPFAGRAGLRRKTFHRVVNELLGRWEDHGVLEFHVISAHRFEPHLEALLMALTDRAATAIYDLSGIDVSDLMAGDPQSEHGGELETSLMLHLHPDLVRRDAVADFIPDERTLRRYTRGRVPTPPPGSSGSVGRPSLATAEKGAAVFTRYVGTLVEALKRTTAVRQG